jgi:hypothetical protein
MVIFWVVYYWVYLVTQFNLRSLIGIKTRHQIGQMSTLARDSVTELAAKMDNINPEHCICTHPFGAMQCLCHVSRSTICWGTERVGFESSSHLVAELCRIRAERTATGAAGQPRCFPWKKESVQTCQQDIHTPFGKWEQPKWWQV